LFLPFEVFWDNRVSNTGTGVAARLPQSKKQTHCNAALIQVSAMNIADITLNPLHKDIQKIGPKDECLSCGTGKLKAAH